MSVEERRERQEELRTRHEISHIRPERAGSLLRLRPLIQAACELGERSSNP